MSYILEALRRAETERERKRRVPGLHAQPVPVVAADESRAPRSKAWLWVVAGVSAGVLLPLLWRSWPGGAEPEDTGSTRLAVAGSVAPHGTAAAADAARASPATPAADAAANDAARATTAPVPQAAQPTPRAAAVKPGTTRTPPQPEPLPPKPESRSPTTVAPSQVPPATQARAAPVESARPVPAQLPQASAPEPRLRSLAELPEELRRSVPALAFGGSVYSETAAQRMVIFNGQVLREGDAVSDEVLLEQIRPQSAVMRLRGQRFEVKF